MLVGRCYFLAWLIHQSRAWNFNATATASATKTASAEPNPPIIAIASIDSARDTNNSSSSPCSRCMNFANLNTSAPDGYHTVVDRIAIPYMTRQRNDSDFTSFSTETLNISRSDNRSYIAQPPTTVRGQLTLKHPAVIDDLALCARLSPTKSGPCVSPGFSQTRGFSSISNASFTSTNSSRNSNLLSLYRLPKWHEKQPFLTPPPMRAPMAVARPGEDAKQNHKAIIQKLKSITSADNDIKSPSATSDVPVPLQAEIPEAALHHSISNQPPNDLPNGRLANDGKDKPTVISQLAAQLVSAQDPELRPIYEPLTRTQQAGESVPVPIILPDFESLFSSNQLPKVSESKPTYNDLDLSLKESAEFKGANDEKVGDGLFKSPLFDTKPANNAASEASVGSKQDDREKLAVLDETPELVPWIIVDGSRISLLTPSSLPFDSPVDKIRLGSPTLEVLDKSKSGLIIGFHTLLPGDAVTTQRVSTSALPFPPTLAIGSNTMSLSVVAASTPGPQLQTITLDSTSFVVSRLFPSAIVIDSQTLVPGGVITAKGRPVSLRGADNALVVGDRTLTLPSFPTPAPGLPVINGAVINSLTFPVLRLPSSAVLIGSQTLVPGSRITVQDTPISLPSENDQLLVGDKTVRLRPVTAAPQRRLPVMGQVAIDSTILEYSMFSPSSVKLGSQMLKLGSVITINGHHVSFILSPSIPSTVESNINKILLPKPKLADSDTLIIQTIALGDNENNNNKNNEVLILTRAPSSPSEIIFGTQTLAPGSPAITVNGQPISLLLLPSASAIVLGSTLTVPLPPVPKVTEAGSTFSGFATMAKSNHHQPQPQQAPTIITPIQSSSLTTDRQETWSLPTSQSQNRSRSRITMALPTPTNSDTGIVDGGLTNTDPHTHTHTNSASASDNRALESWRNWSWSWSWRLMFRRGGGGCFLAYLLFR